MATPAGASGPTLLSSISGLSVEFELDATLEDSYGGSGKTWANVIESPHSGAAQTAYDFYLGADGAADDGDEPTFNGTAGDSAAYWGFDGSDFFLCKDGDTDFVRLAMLYSAGGDECQRWWGVAFRASGLGFNDQILSTANTGSGDNFMQIETRGNGGDARFDAEGNPGETLRVDTASLSNGTDYLMLVSYDTSSASNNFRVWINTLTASQTSETRMVWTDQSSANQFALGAYYDGTSALSSGTRFYGAYAGNTFLTDAKAAEIFSLLEARHNRDYTP